MVVETQPRSSYKFLQLSPVRGIYGVLRIYRLEILHRQVTRLNFSIQRQRIRRNLWIEIRVRSSTRDALIPYMNYLFHFAIFCSPITSPSRHRRLHWPFGLRDVKTFRRNPFMVYTPQTSVYANSTSPIALILVKCPSTVFNLRYGVWSLTPQRRNYIHRRLYSLHTQDK